LRIATATASPPVSVLAMDRCFLWPVASFRFMICMYTQVTQVCLPACPSVCIYELCSVFARYRYTCFLCNLHVSLSIIVEQPLAITTRVEEYTVRLHFHSLWNYIH
jgi:hypothetical protein